MTRPYRPSRAVQRRTKYARTNGDLLVNSPPGFPSGHDPVVWWWGDDSPQYVTPLAPHTALAAVTRATSLIVNTLTSLPWRILAGGTTPRAQETQTEMPVPRWLTDPMLVRRDDRFPGSTAPAAVRMTRAQFWAQWVRSALWHGMGYLIFEEDFYQQPVAGTLRILNPDMVSSTSEGGFVHRRIGNGEQVQTDFDGRFTLGSRPYRLIELSNPTAQLDDDGMAKGVLAVHAAELELAQQSLRYAKSSFRSGVPSGYLKTTIPNFGKEAADRLRAQWLNHHGGDERSVGVLNATTEFVPISFRPIDMDLVNARQMSLLDISNAFGVPSFYLGFDSSSSNTYMNGETRNQDLQRSITHWATGVEDSLGALFPTGTWVEIDFRGLLRAETKTRYESYSVAIRDGWLLKSEVRAVENLPPIAGIDEEPERVPPPIQLPEEAPETTEGDDDADAA